MVVPAPATCQVPSDSGRRRVLSVSLDLLFVDIRHSFPPLGDYISFGLPPNFSKWLAGDAAVVALWDKPLTAEERQARNEAIFDLWLGGETETAIAEKAVMGQQSISDILKVTAAAKAEASGITEQPPIYNVWNYAQCDPRFGQKRGGSVLIWGEARLATNRVYERLGNLNALVGLLPKV